VAKSYLSEDQIITSNGFPLLTHAGLTTTARGRMPFTPISRMRPSSRLWKPI